MITVINNETGNFSSVLNMIKKTDNESILSDSYDQISKSDILILPGVGNFDHVMSKIYEKKIDKAIFNALENNCKLLGICVGMQALFSKSEEGSLEGLKLIEGEVIKFNFQDKKFKVPHMGWNNVKFSNDKNFSKILKDNRFYFVHSFYVNCFNSENIIGTTNHCFNFTSVVKKNNIYGAQFHPEKSHYFGKQFLKLFIES